MHAQLLSFLTKPTLWQRSAEPFWDDEHISKSMLAAHLDESIDAASRKLDTIERSVKWLATMIPTAGKVLDLGCGPGLYAKRLSGLGYKVTGIDLSRRSIEYAKSADDRTDYYCQNYLEMDDAEAFDAILLIYCDYAALTQPERRALLVKVHRALKPDGLFIFDVFTDAHFQSKKERSAWSLHEGGGFWSASPHLCLEATRLYEGGTVAADQYVIVTAQKATEYIIWDTAFNRQRLADELSTAGLDIRSVYGNVCGSAYTDSSDTLCCVAGRRQGTQAASNQRAH